MAYAHALIVDDDPNNLEVLARLLTAQGVSYTAIQDPTQVVTTLEEIGSVDVVFLDLEMPKVNGYQVFETLQSIFDTEIPIVACTVYTNELDSAQDLGFHSFLGKPLDAAHFPNQLERILSGESVWEP